MGEWTVNSIDFGTEMLDGVPDGHFVTIPQKARSTYRKVGTFRHILPSFQLF
jgi:hypothetical protein